MNQIKETIEGRNGYLIRGKFDMEDGSRPDTVLFEALNSFFGSFVDEADADKRGRMRRRIIDTISRTSSPTDTIMTDGSSTVCSNASCRDLIQSIPNLGKLLGTDIHLSNDLTVHHYLTQLPQRSKFLLCKLIGAIADATTPVVLVLDDLQWCDETSLSVYQTIVSDPGEQRSVNNIHSLFYYYIQPDSLFSHCHFVNASYSSQISNIVSMLDAIAMTMKLQQDQSPR